MSIFALPARYRRIIIILFGLLCVCATLRTIGKGWADTLPNTQAPQGFSINSVVYGLNAPTVAQFAPDGRIFVAQKNGIVKIVKNGALLGTPFYTASPVNTYSDRGLMGMALDPNFSTNGYVYLLYTYDRKPSVPDGVKQGRLVRVTASGDTAVAGSEKIILGSVVGTDAQPSCDNFPVNTDCIPADYLSHGPDSLVFGPDGKLYMSIGESAHYDIADISRASRAQNLDSMAGKILRINAADGTGMSDNPYYDGDAAHIRSKIFAYGFRNPFRMGIRPSDGLVVVGDVGWNFWEEINVVAKGSNYGWPCYEGNEQQNGAGSSANKYKETAFCQQMYQNLPVTLKSPDYVYAHPPSSAIVGGVFYTGSNYPSGYNGSYFFGDFSRSQIYTLKLDAQNKVIPSSVQTFASNTLGPVNFFTGPNGDIYYIAINDGAIYRITYTSTNQPPIAVAGADKTSGGTPLTVNFTSAGTSDPDNDALTYRWDFGDGSAISTLPNPSYTYTTSGSYTAVMTVTDSANHSTSKSITISAGLTPPVVTISAPAANSIVAAGQAVTYTGSATDATDGQLADDKLNWNIEIHHCPLDSCHVHPLTTFTGPSGNFNYPPHDGPYFIKVNLSATNSLGLTTTKYVTVYPQGQKPIHAIQLDGLNDYGYADNSADFALQQFTAEAMVKMLTTDSGGAEVMSMGNNWMLRVFPSGVLSFSFDDAGVWRVVNADTVNVKDGIWHHVAVTKSATEVKLYVDGALKKTFATTKPITYNHSNVFIVGAHGDEEPNYNLNGTLDEVRVWSFPRSDADINTYRATTLPATGLSGLTAYWQMEEGDGLTSADASPTHAHKLNLVNGIEWTLGAPLADPATTPPPPPPPPPSTNNAVVFNGSATSKATVNGGTFNTQSLTVEVWAKVSGVASGGGELVSNGNNYGLRIRPDGSLNFFTHNGSRVWKGYNLTGVNLKDNAWHQIVVTKDLSNVKFYIDGVLKKTVTVTNSISYTLGNNFSVGQHANGDPAFNLTGSVDEVRIWNVARTATQITNNKNIEITAPQTNLLGYWRFNETSGPAADLSGKNHPLALGTGVTRGAGFPKN